MTNVTPSDPLHSTKHATGQQNTALGLGLLDARLVSKLRPWFLLYLFIEKGSLCSPGCLGVLHVDQAGLTSHPLWSCFLKPALKEGHSMWGHRILFSLL